MRSPSWSGQQLTEFLAVVAASHDKNAALRDAVERAGEALEAEISAVVIDERVIASVGFPAGASVDEAILAAARGESATISVETLGDCTVVAVPLETDDCGLGTFLVARSGADPFDREEAALLRGMARVLSLSMRLRTLESERLTREANERHTREITSLLESLQQRHHALEKLVDIQRLITRRAPLQDVLDAITRSAADLLRVEVSGLRLIDPDDPSKLILIALTGVDDGVASLARRSRLGEGVGGRAVSQDRLIVAEDYDESPGAIDAFAADNVKTAMAAPVHEDGRVVGSLAVASRDPARRYDAADQSLLRAFAEYASMALTDAQMRDQMKQAFHDSLTGLPNRALLLDRLEQMLRRARDARSNVAVLFIDLDRFKLVNDTMGHLAGDALLAQVATRIRGCLRSKTDSAARLGGDEFAILAEGLDAQHATALADRVLTAISSPYEIAERRVVVGASIGVAISSRGDEDAGELLRNADLAMYRAKIAGKGRTAIFEPIMYEEVVRRLNLEADLRRGVEQDEIIPHYQPIMDLNQGRIVGFEALMRWRHPDRGLVAPLEFLTIAEETGLIVGMEIKVLDLACAQIVAWGEREGSPLRLHVNLSPRHFHDPSVVHHVKSALVGSGCDPDRLVLEITESTLVEDTSETISKLREIRQLGVHLAIDDFGTGYSSLSYLQRFPVDILKIDKSFIDRFNADPEESALTRAIIKISATLSLETIAEGVERQEQVDRLRDAGCHLAQGYLFSRPVDAAQVPALLDRSRERGESGRPRRGLRVV